ncbi:SRPBCC family protein [Frondihabitans cladoniiphilus]|uniref:Activator of Hsp90 ATPase homologue 1/2-like C-terminal domain-containing protein n=1 Tax=Frondihabitans cladoniiphilus TaxID=715785 RepID=A0ABP8WCJ3_9MICO
MSDRSSNEAHSGTTTHAPRGCVATAMKVVDADPEQIWRALTDPVLVEQYFFGTHVESDWQPGSPITYRGEWNGQPYEDRGTVLEIREPLRLVTDFFSPQSGLPDEPANHQVVSYRIQPIDGGCRVTVEQDNNADDEAAALSSSNWQTILDGLATVAPTA